MSIRARKRLRVRIAICGRSLQNEEKEAQVVISMPAEGMHKKLEVLQSLFSSKADTYFG